jgi:hypothetical protein
MAEESQFNKECYCGLKGFEDLSYCTQIVAGTMFSYVSSVLVAVVNILLASVIRRTGKWQMWKSRSTEVRRGEERNTRAGREERSEEQEPNEALAAATLRTEVPETAATSEASRKEGVDREVGAMSHEYERRAKRFVKVTSIEGAIFAALGRFTPRRFRYVRKLRRRTSISRKPAFSARTEKDAHNLKYDVQRRLVTNTVLTS